MAKAKRSSKYKNLRIMSVGYLDAHRQSRPNMSLQDLWNAIEIKYRRKHPVEYQQLMVQALETFASSKIGYILRRETLDTDNRVRLYGAYKIIDDRGKPKWCWKRWEYMIPSERREAWDAYIKTVIKDIDAAVAQEGYINSILANQGLKPLDPTWREDIKTHLSE